MSVIDLANVAVILDFVLCWAAHIRLHSMGFIDNLKYFKISI